MTMWFLGAMNDALFIIDRPPSPSGTDVAPHDRYGPSLSLSLAGLSQTRAQAVVDQHNTEIAAAAVSTETMRQACIEAALAELLTDATGISDDEAYNRAIADVVAAIRAIDASQLATAVGPAVDVA